MLHSGFDNCRFYEAGPVPNSFAGRIRVALWHLFALGSQFDTDHRSRESASRVDREHDLHRKKSGLRKLTPKHGCAGSIPETVTSSIYRSAGSSRHQLSARKSHNRVAAAARTPRLEQRNAEARLQVRARTRQCMPPPDISLIVNNTSGFSTRRFCIPSWKQHSVFGYP